MNKRTRTGWIVIVLAVLILATPLPLRADGYRNPPPSAVGIATAGASHAWTDGAAAVASNPAGLMDLERSEVLMSATFTRLHTTFTPAGTGLELSSRKEWNILPNIFIGGPTSSPTRAWGLGVTTPYGQSMKWRADDPAPWRYTRPYSASMQLVETSPAAAFQLTEQLTLGVAVSVFLSELQFDQHVPAELLGGLSGPDATLRFDGDAEAFGGTLGLQWDPANTVRLGLHYKTPIRLSYSGDVNVQHPLLPPGIPDGSFRTTIDLPDSLTAAFGIRLGDSIRLEVSAEHLRWSRQKNQTISVRGPLPIPTQRIEHQWEDTWTVGLACEWAPEGPWSIRGGYRFMQTPIPDKTYSLVLPDADRHVIGVGVGYTRGRHRLDAAWSYSEFRTRTISPEDNPAMAGRHSLSADLASLSYRYSF